MASESEEPMVDEQLAEQGRLNEVGRKMNAALDYMGDFLKCACAGRRVSRPLIGGYTKDDISSMGAMMQTLGDYLDGCGVMDEEDEDQAVVTAGFDAYSEYVGTDSAAPAREHRIDVSGLHPIQHCFAALAKLQVPFEFTPAEPEVGIPAYISIPSDQVERVKKLEAEMREDDASARNEEAVARGMLGS